MTTYVPLHVYLHAIVGKLDAVRLQNTIVIVAAIPVFLKMNKQDLSGLDACCQFERLFEGIQGGSRDVFCRVFEVMFQTTLEYPRLDDKEVGLLNLSSILRERLEIAGSIDDLAPRLFKDVNEG